MILKFSSAGCNRNLQQKEAKFKKSAQDFKMSRNWIFKFTMEIGPAFSKNWKTEKS